MILPLNLNEHVLYSKSINNPNVSPSTIPLNPKNGLKLSPNAVVVVCLTNQRFLECIKIESCL